MPAADILHMNVGSVRLATPDDARAISEIYAPIVRHTAVSFELDPPSAEQMAARIRQTLAQFPWVVFQEAGRVVGYAFANAFRDRAAYRWCAEVAVYVEPQWHRRGIARHLYASLFDLLDLQGYRVLYAVIALPNPASLALHERMGFRNVALLPATGYKLGRWSDVAWMQHELRPQTQHPIEPVKLSHLSPDDVAKTLARIRL